MKQVGRLAVRYRWAVLAVWSAVWFLPLFLRGFEQPGEWLFFEAGAFTIDNLTPQLHGGLSVYVVDPAVQIGPPSLLLLAGAVKVVTAPVAEAFFAVVMAAMGVVVVASAEVVALARCGPERREQVKALTVLAGLVATAVWASQSALWRHLDDSLAVLLIAVAFAMLTRSRCWWLVAVLLGCAAAAQPWAVVAAPLVLLLPRPRWATTVLLLGAVIAAWWLPFVVAAPATVHALGSFHVSPAPGSVLALLGVHGDQSRWLRPVQLVSGVAMCALLVRRVGGPRAVMTGFCVRLLLDPYVWSYYVLAPLAAAVLIDLDSGGRWPRWTLATTAVLVAAPAHLDASTVGLLRLVAGVVALVVIIRPVVSQRFSLVRSTQVRVWPAR